MKTTNREAAVLSLIAFGLTDREIANELSVEVSTARKHRENLLFKFGAKKSTQLVTSYFRNNEQELKKSR